MTRTYLGDGVYLRNDHDRGPLILTTTDGITNTNTIYLEREVAQALLAVLQHELAQEENNR